MHMRIQSSAITVYYRKYVSCRPRDFHFVSFQEMKLKKKKNGGKKKEVSEKLEKQNNKNKKN